MRKEEIEQEIDRRARERRFKQIRQLGPQKSTTLPYAHPPQPYHYEMLSAKGGIFFLRDLYHALLKREVDHEGSKAFLEALTSGRMSKAEIITRIRFSKEGKRHNIPLRHARRHRLMLFVWRLPIIGAIARRIAFLWSGYQKLNQIENRLSLVEGSYATRSEIDAILKPIQTNIASLYDQYNTLNQQCKQLTHDIHGTQPIAPFLREPFDSNQSNSTDEYIALENLFYPTDVVTQKQHIYLPIAQQTPDSGVWLDVGCGRGEFLSLLKKEGIEAIGIEPHEPSRRIAQEKGIAVVGADAVSYLAQGGRIFRGISALQVVEHLSYDDLKRFLGLAYGALADGGAIILETINTQNPIAMANFYIDPTHQRPIPPQLLAFLCQRAGFKEIEILYTFPNTFHPDPKARYNDYAIIAYKKSGQ